MFLSDANRKQEHQQSNLKISINIRSISTEISHGIISAQSDVRVVLNTPIESWNNGDELDSDLLRVSPKTKGKVVSLDNRTLAFIPENGFKQDTEYQFTVLLSEIVKDLPKDLKTMTFGVKTLKQQFNIYTNALQSYSKSRQYINGQLKASDVLTLETAKQLVSASHKGQLIHVKFDNAIKKGTQFQFKIDSIQRYEDDSDLEISWDGAKFDIDSSGKNSITISGKNNFKVLDVSTETGESQVVLINFSDPIKKGQNFKGLVTLEGSSKPKYAVDGNTLRLYTMTELKGSAKLEVLQGIKSEDGHKLKNQFEENITFEQLKPEVRLLSNGTILPSSNNLKINFETVNLKAVDVSVFKIYEDNVLQFLQKNNLNGRSNLRSVARPIARKKIVLENNLTNSNGKWAAYTIDLSTLISPEVGAMYRVKFNFRPSYSLYTCGATNFDDIKESEDNFDEEQEFSSWNDVENYNYGYNWNERENPCNKAYYSDKYVAANVLATDIGVVIKRGTNKSYFIAVADILNTNPIAGAKVTFYNFQQQVVGYVNTDVKGMAIFDSEKEAFFAVVENNQQKNYVKLNDGNALSVSKFNVSGTSLQKGIKGFIFGERGVWRPGDKLFFRLC